MAIVEGISAAKAAFEVSKVALDLTRHPKLDIHTIQDRLLELQGLILNAQRSLGDAEDEIRTLKRALDDREALKTLEADMDFVVDGHFYVKKSERDKGLIPYCPLCWTADRKAVHLTHYSGPGGFGCSIHNTNYSTREQAQWLQGQSQLQEEAYRRNTQISEY